MLSVSCLDHQLVSTIRGGNEEKPLICCCLIYFDRQRLLSTPWKDHQSITGHTCKHVCSHAHTRTHTARTDLQTLIKLMCMCLDCGRKLQRTCTGTGRNSTFQSCNRKLMFEFNFKSLQRFLISLNSRTKSFTPVQRAAQKIHFHFYPKGHFLCNNHIRVLTFINMANPNISINIKVFGGVILLL